MSPHTVPTANFAGCLCNERLWICIRCLHKSQNVYLTKKDPVTLHKPKMDLIYLKKNPDPSQNRYCNCTWKWHLNHCRSKCYEHSVFSIAACMHPFIHLFLLPVAAVFIITDWIALVSLDLWESGNQKYHQQMWLLPSFVVFKGVLLCLIWNGTALVLKVLGR